MPEIHESLIRDWRNKRAGTKFIPGKTSISFRIDHGLVNFDAKMRENLEKHNFPYALALGSRHWDAIENKGISPSQVNQWVSGGLAEVWSHGPSHKDADTEEKLYDFIVNSRKELEADIPAAVIDGFMPPGAGGTRYMGFGPTDTEQKFLSTIAGQLILRTYAVSTGQIADRTYRIQDGVPRLGHGYINIDKFSTRDVMNRVILAIRKGSGIQLMIHPSLIDKPGYISTDQIHEILERIKVLELRGEIVVMSAYDQLLADSRT